MTSQLLLLDTLLTTNTSQLQGQDLPYVSALEKRAGLGTEVINIY